MREMFLCQIGSPIDTNTNTNGPSLISIDSVLSHSQVYKMVQSDALLLTGRFSSSVDALVNRRMNKLLLCET